MSGKVFVCELVSELDEHLESIKESKLLLAKRVLAFLYVHYGLRTYIHKTILADGVGRRLLFSKEVIERVFPFELGTENSVVDGDLLCYLVHFFEIIQQSNHGYFIEEVKVSGHSCYDLK